jgi:hypothetical protein
VQAALDHSNLATTSIYLRQLEGQEDPWWPKLAAELGLEGGGEAFPPAEERPLARLWTARRGRPRELRRRRKALGWTLEQVAAQAPLQNADGRCCRDRLHRLPPGASRPGGDGEGIRR